MTNERQEKGWAMTSRRGHFGDCANILLSPSTKDNTLVMAVRHHLFLWPKRGGGVPNIMKQKSTAETQVVTHVPAGQPNEKKKKAPERRPRGRRRRCQANAVVEVMNKSKKHQMWRKNQPARERQHTSDQPRKAELHAWRPTKKRATDSPEP